MNKDDEIVEVAIFKAHSHYDNYGDEVGTHISPMVGSSEWVELTRGELKSLVENRWAIAQDVGVEGLFVIERQTAAQTAVCVEAIRTLIKKKEADRIAADEKRRKMQERALMTAKDRKIEKARKDLAKAQKILAEAGDLI